MGVSDTWKLKVKVCVKSGNWDPVLRDVDNLSSIGTYAEVFLYLMTVTCPTWVRNRICRMGIQKHDNKYLPLGDNFADAVIKHFFRSSTKPSAVSTFTTVMVPHVLERAGWKTGSNPVEAVKPVVGQMIRMATTRTSWSGGMKSAVMKMLHKLKLQFAPYLPLSFFVTRYFGNLDSLMFCSPDPWDFGYNKFFCRRSLIHTYAHNYPEDKQPTEEDEAMLKYLLKKTPILVFEEHGMLLFLAPSPWVKSSIQEYIEGLGIVWNQMVFKFATKTLDNSRTNHPVNGNVGGNGNVQFEVGSACWFARSCSLAFDNADGLAGINLTQDDSIRVVGENDAGDSAIRNPAQSRRTRRRLN